jgi:hypothetical protein
MGTGLLGPDVAVAYGWLLTGRWLHWFASVSFAILLSFGVLFYLFQFCLSFHLIDQIPALT